MGYNTKFSGVFMMGQKGQIFLYMINCISIVLNGRNHRGSFRGSSRGSLRSLRPS